MNTFRQPIQIGDSDQKRFETVEALVDPVNHALVPIVLNLFGFSQEEHGN